MSSWVQLLLLLALQGTSLRCGATQEEEPLPAALVELVRNSPISSIEDLQLLLLSDSVDEEDGLSPVNGGHRLPRSLDAQPAQQALCKVRTEVVEVTRAMLDRSNANFLLWPPCVEVQRCSGCCNAKSLLCVPVVTHTRYLQVMKVEYVSKRPSYAKAVVSVVDHVECRCQPAPRVPASKRKSSRRQHNHQHGNQTLSHGQGQVKLHSKDELHQWDELKQNQRARLEDFLGQNWSPRGDSFSQPGHGFSPAGEESLLATHWSSNSSRLLETKEGVENVERRNGHASDVRAEVKNTWAEDMNGFLNSTERSMDSHTQSPLQQDDKSKTVTHNPHNRSRPTKAPGFERVVTRFRPTKEPNPDPRELGRRMDNKTPDEEEEARVLLIEEEKLEQERKELLLLHMRLDQEKEILRQQQERREEERREEERREEERQREKEREHHLHGKHHHHQHTVTTQTPATASTTTTRQPTPPVVPKPPARPKKRMRKNRKRISKAAMRAMLM